MFCKNCGSQIDPNAAICVKCGFKKGEGVNYCSNCGQPINNGASVCMSCGYAINTVPQYDASAQKSKIVAGILAILCGSFGIHNFYLGYTGKAVVQLLLCCTGISSIWALIEGIMIFTGHIDKDAKGIPLKD